MVNFCFNYMEVALITTTGYLLYIQFSSTMGNIWIRENHFVPYNAVRMMFHPLIDYKMWTYTSMWPINYFIWLLIGYLIYIFSKNRNYLRYLRH